MNDTERDLENPDADAWRARAEAAEASLAAVRAEMGRRLADAALKAEAVRAGMIDLDGLKLIDADALPRGETGDVADAAGVIETLKRGKPWLFAQRPPASSSSTAAAPRPEPARARSAREMSVDEWRVARAALLRRD